MITEIVYLDRDNVNSLVLRANGSAQDISNLSRVTLKIGEVVLDSRIHSNVFDWSTSGTSGQLDMTLGHQDLRVGTFRSTLTVYDNSYPRGLVWGDLMIQVREA